MSGLIQPRRSLRNSGQYGAPASPRNLHNNSTGSNRTESNESSDNESESIGYNSRNMSLNSTNQSAKSQVFEREEESFGYFRETKTYSYSKTTDISEESAKTAKKPAQDSNPILIYIAFTFLLIAVFIGVNLYRSSNPMEKPKFQCLHFKELQKQFTRQDALLWKSLKVGIENVLNQTPAQPSVFLLAYNDAETSKNVMAKILNVTAECMQSQNPIKLDGRSFANEKMLEDYGVIIDTYREQLKSEGIMYVADLHETPARAAHAFHTICDTITPFVERSVIFFTLKVDQYNKQMKPKQVHELVEAKLQHNWNEINHDTLQALIGRVTDQVFLLHSENDIQ